MNDREWNVKVDFATPEHLDEDRLVALGELVEQWDATVGARGDTGPGFILIVDIATQQPTSAAVDAVDLAHKLAASGDLAGEVAAVEVQTQELAELAAFRPDTPELLAATDVAALLGVSRQRVHQLHADRRDFPAPYTRLGSGPVWTRPAVEAFSRNWTRKPGRPAAASAS